LPQAANPRKEEKQMSKMAEMAQTIEELTSAAASINAAADWLYQQFSGDDAPSLKVLPRRKKA
jgi:hypothetical protein